VAEGNYEAMVIGCIDPRLVEPMHQHMTKLAGKYSQMMIAGAAIAAAAHHFETWHPAFWGNIQKTIDMHHIKRLIVIDHRDCGAAKLAFGEAAIATPDKETELHRQIFAQFRTDLRRRHPELAVEALLMALDGTVKIL
jgi:carbonic anhydrase